MGGGLLASGTPEGGERRWRPGAPEVAEGAPFVGSKVRVGISAGEQPREEELDAIARETAALRGLPIRAEIETRFLPREEAMARAVADIDEEYPVARAEADGRSLAAFGLLPAGTDLRAAYVRWFERGVAGFYDPETDALFVIDEDGRLEVGSALTYSHEVVHALQDQHLGLDGLDGDIGGRLTDSGLAVAALVEGGASVAGFDYLVANPEWFEREGGGGSLLERLLNVGAAATPAVGAEGTPAATATPEAEPVLPLLVATSPFPYSYGSTFVRALRAKGGWAEVDAAYGDPPRTTEQVMHPEKFLGDRDDPTSIALPDAASALGPGWRAVAEESLGEFLAAVVLASDNADTGVAAGFGRERIPEPIANAAAGWDGDRYALWEGEGNEVLVWRSAWDSERDGRAFALALLAREEARWGTLHRGESLDALALTAGDGEVRLALAGREVYYVLAPDAATAERALSALRGS